MQLIWKWYLKNKDAILTRTIAGLLVLFIYGIISFFIGAFKNVRVPTNEILQFLVVFVNYEMNISFTISVFSITVSLILVGIFLGLLRKFRIKNILNQSKLRIVKATYGTENKNVDITQELNLAIVDDKLNLLLTNNIAGDPDVGIQKIGNIIYKFDGKKFKKEVVENSPINLP